MRRILILLLVAFVFFSSSLYAQKFADSVTSSFLKMKMPTGTVRQRSADSIRRTTSMLDSFTVLKDYSLNKYSAETFYVSNFDSLKARLNKNNWTISRLGGSDSYTSGAPTYYSIKKDSFNYVAVVTPQDQQTMVSMKPLTVSTSSQPYTQVNKIVASDRINNVEFGRAVAISNNYAVVGEQLEDNDAEGKNPKQDAGAAYIYERGADGNWKQVQKIVAADRAPGANFGWSVSVSGNIIVVGAIYERFDATGRNESTSEGAAYVFERGSDGVWKQTQKLLSSNRDSGYDYFGSSVGVDGNIIVVGAPGHSRDSTERQEGYVGDAGAVFVFEKKGTNWRRTYKLLASDREHGGSMGNSVAISGNRVIAGAWAQDFGMNGENRMEASGAAYIWERMDDGKWTKGQKLIASDRSPYDEFGFSVAIDGDNAVVGARNVTLKKGDEDNNGYSGEAYIFSCNENGEWKEVEAIIPKERKTGDLVGASVGVSGNYVIIGSPRGDGKKPYIGAVYIYWKNPQGKWMQTQKINASDEGTYANFSTGLAIHKDLIISGAPMEWRDVAGKNEFSNAGAAYIFMRGVSNSGKSNTQPSKQPQKTPAKKTN
jgi:ketosteroid isomerase-like protein